jgi:hypothetical protein
MNCGPAYPAVLWSVDHTPCARARLIHVRHHVRAHRRPRTRACTAARRAGGWARPRLVLGMGSSPAPFVRWAEATHPPSSLVATPKASLTDRMNARRSSSVQHARGFPIDRAWMDGGR